MEVALDVDDALGVVVLEDVSAGAAFDGGDLFEGDDLARGGADGEVGEVLDLVAVAQAVAQADVDGFVAAEVDLADLEAFEGEVDAGGDVGGLDVEDAGHDAVGLDLDLLAQAVVVDDVLGARDGVEQGLDLFGVDFELLVGGVAAEDAHANGAAAGRSFLECDGADGDARERGHLAFDGGADGFAVALARAGEGELDVHLAELRPGVGALLQVDVEGVGAAQEGDGLDALAVGRFAVPLIGPDGSEDGGLDLAGHLGGSPLHGGTQGQLEVDLDPGRIAIGEELNTDGAGAVEEHGGDGGHDGEAEDEDAVLQGIAQGTDVAPAEAAGLHHALGVTCVLLLEAQARVVGRRRGALGRFHEVETENGEDEVVGEHGGGEAEDDHDREQAHEVAHDAPDDEHRGEGGEGGEGGGDE